MVKKSNFGFRLICSVVMVTFSATFIGTDVLRISTAFAAIGVVQLPAGDVKLSEQGSKPVLKGLRFDPQNPMDMKFVIDPAGKEKVSKQEVATLVRYFLTALTVPEADLWVNLSPYESERIIDNELGETELGQEFLAQDYVLKQLSASLTHPDTETGKEYWKLLNGDADKASTFNKIWIMPDQIEIYEGNNNAYITEASLKAMTEGDYLASQSNPGSSSKGQVASEVIKETILPELTKDINGGKNFASLRQVYSSIILGSWFKKKFQESFYAFYFDSEKMQGIDKADPQAADKVYKMYVEAFKKGAYDFIKKEYDPHTNRKVKRHYFSGGITVEGVGNSAITTDIAKIDNTEGIVADLKLNFAGEKSVSSAVAEPILKGSMTDAEIIQAIKDNNLELNQSELGDLFAAQKSGDWERVQLAQERIKATHIMAYERAWQKYFAEHGAIQLFDLENSEAQEIEITAEIAEAFNLKTHYAEFDGKADNSTAGIRSFYDFLHSENPNKMYNDLVMKLLIDSETEFLQEVQKDISKGLDTIEDVPAFIAKLKEDMARDMDESVVEIIEDIYGMSLEELIPFLKDNIVKVVGGEVRAHTAKFVEMEARTLADAGITVITTEKYDQSATIYMFSFLSYLLGATGSTFYTPSHSSNYVLGRKVLAPDGAQLQPDMYELYRQILSRKIGEIYNPAKKYKTRLSAKDDPRIRKVLTYDRMVSLYRSILNLTQDEIKQINQATADGHQITLNNLNGSTWATLKPLLEKAGIDPDVFDVINEEEDRFFNAGYLVEKTENEDGTVTYSVDHAGLDSTMEKIAKTMPYISELKGKPDGMRVYEGDPDSDRFVIKQIMPDTEKVRNLLAEFGMSFYSLADGKLLVSPSPNKTFLSLDIVDYENMVAEGVWEEFFSLYHITYVSSRAWAEFADAVDFLIRVMSRVGYKNLTDLQRDTEDWYFNKLDQYEFSFEDQLGRTITIDRSKKVRFHSKAEESGGRVAGNKRPVHNVLGQKVLAMPEKSVADSLLSELVVASKEYNKTVKVGRADESEPWVTVASTGDYSVLNYLSGAFDKYGMESKIDSRIDMNHGNQGAIALMDSAEQTVAFGIAGGKKQNFNNFFFSIAAAVSKGKVEVEAVRNMLSEVIPELKETWQCIDAISFAEEPLSGGRTRPEGTAFEFKARDGNVPLVTEFDFRPSGTDPLKSKVYIDAKELSSERKAGIAKIFGALKEYNLYPLLEKYKIESLAVKPEGDLGLKEFVASSALALAPDVAMDQLGTTLELLKLNDPNRILNIANKSVDAMAYVEKIAEMSGQSIDEVLNQLEVIPGWKPMVTKVRLIKKRDSAESLDSAESTSDYLKVVVGTDDVKFSEDSQVQTLTDQDSGEQAEYLKSRFESAKTTALVHSDDIEDDYLGTALGTRLEKSDFLKNAPKINGQELMDLKEELAVRRDFLTNKVDITKKKRLWHKGIGANIQYLKDLVPFVNNIVDSLKSQYENIDFQWVIASNPGELPLVVESCEGLDNVAEQVISEEESRSGGTAEVANIQALTLKQRRTGKTTETVDRGPSFDDFYVRDRITWANGSTLHQQARTIEGRVQPYDFEDSQTFTDLLDLGLIEANGFVSDLEGLKSYYGEDSDAYKVAKRQRENYDPKANVLHIDNTPGYIGGRHMNNKTSMVYGPMYTALSILGYQMFQDKEKAFDWAEEMVLSYARASMETTVKMSPKAEDLNQAMNNEASVFASEVVRKKNVEGRIKVPIIATSDLMNQVVETIQHLGEGVNKPAPGKEENNTMFSFYDAGDKKTDYVRDMLASPELYQPIFKVNKSHPQAKEMYANIAELVDAGVPVKVIEVDISEKENLVDGLKLRANGSGFMQSFVTTYAHLTDQDFNSNPAVKGVREDTPPAMAVLSERIEELGRSLNASERRIPFAAIKEKKEKAQAKELEKARTTIKDRLKTISNETPQVLKDFIESTIKPAAKALGVNEDSLVTEWIKHISKVVMFADTAEAGGLKSSLMQAASEETAFGQLLGVATPDKKLEPLNNQVIAFDDGKMAFSLGVSHDISDPAKAELQVNSKEDLPQVLADYFMTHKGDEFNTIGLISADADEGNIEIDKIKAAANESLADFGVNVLSLPMPSSAHAGFEQYSALSAYGITIALAPSQSFIGKDAELGAIEITKGIDINGMAKVYTIANVTTPAGNGTPTVLVEYESAEQLAEIQAILSKAMDAFQMEMAASSSIDAMVEALESDDTSLQHLNLRQIQDDFFGGRKLADYPLLHGAVSKLRSGSASAKVRDLAKDVMEEQPLLPTSAYYQASSGIEINLEKKLLEMQNIPNGVFTGDLGPETGIDTAVKAEASEFDSNVMVENAGAYGGITMKGVLSEIKMAKGSSGLTLSPEFARSVKGLEFTIVKIRETGSMRNLYAKIWK